VFEILDALSDKIGSTKENLIKKRIRRQYSSVKAKWEKEFSEAGLVGAV